MKHLIKPIKIISLALVLFVGLNSCSNEFLEVEPKGNLIATETSDYDLILNISFSTPISDVKYALSTETCMLEPFYGSNALELNKAFQWAPDIYQPDDDITELIDFLTNLYVYNKVINEVQNSKGGTDQEKNTYLAEAKMTRAWINFNLINLFGKPYDPSTSATDLGIPIITLADVTQTVFTRATVQEVYDFILEDLNTAIPHLPAMHHRIRGSLGAGKALLGKVHVFMGNYTEGLAALNEAFTILNNAQLEVGLYDLNVETLPGGVRGPGAFGPNSPRGDDNIEAVFLKSDFSVNGFIFNNVLVSPETAALFGPTDIRLTAFLADAPAFAFWGGPYPAGIRRSKGNQSPNMGVGVADMYLLRAECKARTNDLVGAEEDLLYLREHRMPLEDVAIPTGLSQADLVRFVIDERTREFVMQTDAWDTTRRLFNDPIFSDKTYIHNVYDEDGEITETFTLTENRLVMRFNTRVFNTNPDLINND